MQRAQDHRSSALQRGLHNMCGLSHLWKGADILPSHIGCCRKALSPHRRLHLGNGCVKVAHADGTGEQGCRREGCMGSRSLRKLLHVRLGWCSPAACLASVSSCVSSKCCHPSNVLEIAAAWQEHTPCKSRRPGALELTWLKQDNVGIQACTESFEQRMSRTKRCHCWSAL